MWCEVCATVERKINGRIKYSIVNLWANDYINRNIFDLVNESKKICYGIGSSRWILLILKNPVYDFSILFSRSQGFEVSRYQSFRASRFPGIKFLMFPGIKFLSFQDLEVSRNLEVSRIQGFRI
jgi:hypothetical protein